MAEGPKLESDCPVYCKTRRAKTANGCLREAGRIFAGARKGSRIESTENEEWSEPCDRREEEAA